MKKEKYERTDLIVTRFNDTDVIATSVDQDRAIRSTYEGRPLDLDLWNRRNGGNTQ